MINSYSRLCSTMCQHHSFPGWSQQDLGRIYNSLWFNCWNLWNINMVWNALHTEPEFQNFLSKKKLFRMLSPVLLLKPQNTSTSLLFSKNSTDSKYLKESSTKQYLTYNTLHSSQPSYLRQLFTIQPSLSTRSSFALTLLRLSVTSSLKFPDAP